MPQLLAAEERHLAGIEARVRALDPVNVLARGWSITRSADGRVCASPTDVAVGDVITTAARCRFAAQPRRARREGHLTASAAPRSPAMPRRSTSSTRILRELEGTDVDVDRLADRVARATELIALCRQRIGDARLRIDEVIADLDGERRRRRRWP